MKDVNKTINAWYDARVLAVLKANLRCWYLDATGTNWLRDNMPTLSAYL